jgi:hypothetical protein
MWTRQDQQAADDQAAEREGCLREGGRTPCSGYVRYRYSDLGAAIPECVAHMRESLDRNTRERYRYPDSPIAPDWFDPLDAGERWDDDY